MVDRPSLFRDELNMESHPELSAQLWGREQTANPYAHPFPVDDWIDLRRGPSDSTRRWIYFRRKYFVERMIGWMLLIPTYPLILLLSGIVRLHSKGPGFYRQVRVGYRGQEYEIIKLRTMRVDAEADGKAKWCTKGDPRITRLGKWLRKLHLDELPQLINVARGEMTLVGPRPERPCFVDDLKLQIPGYERRLSVMPGITGLSQINLPPDETIDDVRRKQYLDLLYIDQANFLLDLRMVLATSVRLVGVPGAVVIRMLGLFREIPVELQGDSVEQERQEFQDAWDVNSIAESATDANVAESEDGVSSSGSSSKRLPVSFASTTRHLPPVGPISDDVPNALTVDVEDYFQVSGFEEQVPRSQWEKYPSRVEQSTHRLLELFQRKNVKGTFFVLGWVADKFPELVRCIAEEGHEVGCHSYWHRLVYRLTPDEFRQDLVRAKKAIEHACGTEVTSYRAPSFSITQDSMWAIPILIDEGFTLDSSIFPMKHDRYGVPDATSNIHLQEAPEGSLVEYPPTVWKTKLASVPVGGGYFRLAPRWLTQRAIDANRKLGIPAMFYVHPWEVDPEQPVVENVPWKNRLRHRVGLSTTLRKLEGLLDANRFAPISEVLNKMNQQRNNKVAGTFHVPSALEPQDMSNDHQAKPVSSGTGFQPVCISPPRRAANNTSGEALNTKWHRLPACESYEK